MDLSFTHLCMFQTAEVARWMNLLRSLAPSMSQAVSDHPDGASPDGYYRVWSLEIPFH
jgi:hypothetical protein